jgi:hypothetical protein
MQVDAFSRQRLWPKLSRKGGIASQKIVSARGGLFLVGENEQLMGVEMAVASANLDVRRRLRQLGGMGTASEF